MPLIDKEDSALRLARAIANDVKLYNQERLSRAADPWTELADELAEGRRLYESRVSPQFHGLLETALVEIMPQLAGGPSRPAGGDPEDPPSSIPQGFFSDAPAGPERGGTGALVPFLLLLAVGVAVTWWFVFR
jgi:hypothetical protein